MGISYLENKHLFKLDTDQSSYIIGLADQKKCVGHLYYGPKIHDDDVTYLLRTGETPFLISENEREKVTFNDAFPFEYSTYGVGDYREDCLQVVTEKGQMVSEFVYESHIIKKGKPPIEGLPSTFGDNATTLEIRLVDTAIKAALILSYSVFEDSEVIARHARIENTGKAMLRIEKMLSVCMDMDLDKQEVLTLHGSWARERQIERKPVGHGKYQVASLRGETSHQEHPFMAICDSSATERYGYVYGFNFVYSGNFMAQVEMNQHDQLRFVMGIHPTGFSWELKPGDAFDTPEVIMNFSGQGLGFMTRQFHDAYRKHLIRSPYLHKKRPILINNWEATYFDFNTNKLLDIAKEAAKDGIEMLVMDDGWFGKRNDDNTSLGDWFVNEEKIQGGLRGLVDAVNKEGLDFGIWFEPEMISPQSELFKKHPDWAIQTIGRIPARCRNQYVLDLTREDVKNYIYERLYSILSSANIAYVKWDMNRPLSDIGSMGLPKERQGELSHRFVLALYELQERLITDFPNLLLENCSGGGARFDPGMLYYSPQIWCSDDTDAIERLGIQEGTAMIYPLSCMGAHVSDCPNHTVGRVTPFETRAYVALAGTFGYELDITKISEEDRKCIPKQVDMYHRYNHLVREGDYYRLKSHIRDGGDDAWMVVSKDKKKALVTFIQVLRRPNSRSQRLLLDGLDSDRLYEVTYEEKYFQLHGSSLMSSGLLMEAMWGDFKGRLIEIKAIEG